MYGITTPYTSREAEADMRTNIDVDDQLMADAQQVSGHATKKQTVEEALRLMIQLKRQRDVAAAFGKFRWRADLDRSRRS